METNKIVGLVMILLASWTLPTHSRAGGHEEPSAAPKRAEVDEVEESIKSAYQTFLGRPGSPEERSGWVGSVKNGKLTLHQAIMGISESPEALKRREELRKAGPPPEMPGKMRTNEEVIRGLIAAEGCLAMIAVVAILIRKGGVEKAVGIFKKGDQLILNFVKAFGVGENVAWLLVKIGELSGGTFLVKELTDVVWKMCKRGAEEIAIAVKDAPDALGTVVGGVDQTQTKRLEEQLKANSPIRVARKCWEGSSRGVFETKREEAHKCCNREFPDNAHDAQACRNNVDTIADQSGW